MLLRLLDDDLPFMMGTDSIIGAHIFQAIDAVCCTALRPKSELETSLLSGLESVELRSITNVNTNPIEDFVLGGTQ